MILVYDQQHYPLKCTVILSFLKRFRDRSIQNRPRPSEIFHSQNRR